MYEEHHVNNGIVIGAILLCLKDEEVLKRSDLNKILKNINLIDSKKGSQIWFNPTLIEEETQFYTSHKFYTYNMEKDCWQLKNRLAVEAYCLHYADTTLKTAVARTFNKNAETNLSL